MARTYRSTPEPVYANKTAELVKKDGSIIKTDDLQEKLTFDTTPTANSTNPVTSGGIKNYVDSLMSGALKRAIVEALPETDIDTNTIYMVLDESASQQGNVYNEYLYINNAWELIGTTEVSGLDIVELDSDSGNVNLPLPTAFDAPAITIRNAACGLLFKSGEYVVEIVTEEGTIFVNHITYSSTMNKDGRYLLMDITMPTDLLVTTATYIITEETRSSIEYVELQSEGGTLTQEQITKLENGAWVKDEFGSIYMPSNPPVIYSAPIYCDYDAGKGYINQLAIVPFTGNYTFSRYTFNIDTAQ